MFLQFIGNNPTQSADQLLNAAPSSFCREGVNKITNRLVLQENVKKTTVGKSLAAADTGDEGVEAGRRGPEQAGGEASSRNPDKGMACFVNIEDPTPQQHPRGEYPYDNERGKLLVKMLKKLFSIIPSKSDNSLA